MSRWIDLVGSRFAPGRLLRSIAFESQKPRKGQWPAVGMRNVVCTESLGGASLGLTLPECPGSFPGSFPGPCERYATWGRRHTKIIEWAWQLLLLGRRRYLGHEIVATDDNACARLRLPLRCEGLSRSVPFITRLRPDVGLFEPASPRRPAQVGRPRLKGKRLANLSVVAEVPTIVWKPTAITY